MIERLKSGPGGGCAVHSVEVLDYPDTKIKLHFSHFKLLVSIWDSFPLSGKCSAFYLRATRTSIPSLLYRCFLPRSITVSLVSGSKRFLYFLASFSPRYVSYSRNSLYQVSFFRLFPSVFNGAAIAIARPCRKHVPT